MHILHIIHSLYRNMTKVSRPIERTAHMLERIAARQEVRL